ncbi:pyrroloquinoline quinone biosynthesis protein PqqB [Nonomuraea sp. NPDC050547]|uniref:pyrroloquinoline quinone biosynthesis protein PqqB n=1 Tax=Nonomuraea sp. NPDC050547 TaxID=3364368 RepID=UPI0037A5C0BB
MRLQVLGTAAGGGVPQWNCACPGCAGARAHPAWRRRHASLAVQLPGRAAVVNATPDIAAQIEDCPWSAPDRDHAPLVVLTDAELDHTLGLLRLREAASLDVAATLPVRRALRPFEEILRPYAPIRWHPMDTIAEPIPVSAKRPRYAAAEETDGAWVSALRFTDGRSNVVYAPAMGVWTPELDTAFRAADCVIIDGTFWDDEEPRRTGISSRTATGMGHLPIEDTMERLAALPGRCLYTHLNNTNPLVDPDALHHKVLAELGVEVAADGMVIEL